MQSILSQLSKVKRLVVLTDRKAPVTGKLEFVGEYEELLGAASPDFEFDDFDENVQATTFYTTGTQGCRRASTIATANWCFMRSRNWPCSVLRRSKAASIATTSICRSRRCSTSTRGEIGRAHV